MYEIKLDYEELKLLDGKVNNKAQDVIDKAKKENSYRLENKLLREILRKSEEIGTLNWRYVRDMRYCPNCGKTHEYFTYTRNSQYHNKGDKNYDRPKYFRGIQFNRGFISFAGSGDFCDECIEKISPVKTLYEYILEHDLKIQIEDNNQGFETKYIKDDQMICYHCKKEMWKSEMGDVRRAFAEGSYKGECPHCKSKSNMLINHNLTHKWRMIEK